ncbi:MAG: PHP domain-containing protein, partial [Chloroflexota bacterium]|nr:PHP domain-containing protein [Chloroflexota bacterium]
LDDLEGAARDGRLATVSGFGPKSVETLLESIRVLRAQRGRIPRYLAEAVAHTALHGLRQMGDLAHVTVVGGIRRRVEMVRRIDLLAASDTPAAVLEAFSRLALFREVTPLPEPPQDSGEDQGVGEDRDSEEGQDALPVSGAVAYTREHYPVLLRVVPPALWGPALQRFTGSPLHNNQLRERAQSQGLAVQGLFLLQPNGRVLEAPDEATIYRHLGLPELPPELREGRGEIAAALTGRLPRLIELADIRGDLHLHTSWSDGSHTIGQMARRSQALGREYIAISDHSQSLGVARGLTLERLAEQRREIATVDAELQAERRAEGERGIRILSSVELDIKSDGTLDYPDETLAAFDFVTASIHSGFQQSAEQLTQRVIAAMRSSHVDAIGHLTGRVLGRREALEMDVEAILHVAAQTGTAMEINAWPNRLDLHEGHARRAKELGVKLVINTDSHADDQLEYMCYGVEVARRGWIEPADVLNTLPLEDLIAYLAARPHKG